MKFLIMAALIFCFELKAHDECGATHPPSLDDNFHKLLEWFGANELDISKAPCKSKLPTEDEINKFIQSKSSGKTSANIHGVQFKDEAPELIEAFKQFTTAHDEQGYYKKKENQKAIQSEYKINPECDKVMCAMEKIWGKDIARKMIYIKLKYGFNTSELAFENSARFTKEELDDVLLGLEDLPRNFLPTGINQNQRLAHFTRGQTLEHHDQNAIANAVVMLFDKWTEESSSNRQYTIFHEAAHIIAHSMNRIDESPEWLNLSGWIKKGDDWSVQPGSCFASKYSSTDPWEDFAEAVATYRYNAKALEKNCPEKYDFIKNNVFQEIEYTQQKSCTLISDDQIAKVQKNLIEELNKLLGKPQFTEQELIKACRSKFSSYPLKEEELSICSLSLHSSKLNQQQINKAFKKFKIQNNLANRNLVFDNFFDIISKDGTLLKNASTKSQAVKETIDLIVQSSIETALPESFSKIGMKPDSVEWNIAGKKCKEHFLNSESDLTKKCLLQNIVSDDKLLQKWDEGHFPVYIQPVLFKKEAYSFLEEKRNAALVEHLKKHPMTEEAYQIQKTKLDK